MDVDNLANVMRTENGRHLISDILQLTQYGQYGTEGNALKDARYSGNREIGGQIVAFIKSIEATKEQDDGLALLYLMEREAKRRKESGE